ncbi:MAG: hypothetical protein Q8922_00295 [Bacteroidota bacterium]|nr:hypothetical protein [Bacteroidota bacterium]MDP4232473.1 hypothetical protein [Bacteroidota bacterium]MDP4286353.1 hypothetical protein [Bacteroidota bacterium]
MSARPEQVRRAGIGLAMAAAGAAAAYGIGRIFLKRNSAARQYRHQLEEWLDRRLETLSQVLGTTAEIANQLRDEVRSAARAALSMAQKSRTIKPEKRNLIEIELDRRLLKMKMKIHKILDISEAAQTEALHRFYEELRSWIVSAGEHQNTREFAQFMEAPIEARVA